MVQEATDQRTPHRSESDMRALVGTVEHDLITSSATASIFRADSPPAYHLTCDRVIIDYQAPWDEGAVRTRGGGQDEKGTLRIACDLCHGLSDFDIFELAP